MVVVLVVFGGGGDSSIDCSIVMVDRSNGSGTRRRKASSNCSAVNAWLVGVAAAV